MKIRSFTRSLFFFIILLHVTLLDFMFVNHSGLVFLPKENSELLTISVHLLIAFVSLLSLIMAEEFRKAYKAGRFSVREPLLIAASIAMASSIGYLLIS
ncbi:hypothetical protein HII17_18525 [Thalassotalea sp. M1531]|uniref:Uncharacterized protein n=1 Tax=Thalassotalea algicola TaxID=2716224 RepID=A0A7Y0LFY9_9GAMM|nr:hypothetical protein [Thalassotalea algicola]NMP33547.1 hypothetical protein [Thalassotalea algicola]